ncbi:MAG: hypothetical protein JEZ09_14530 [Salinivirgaceae bacterium]|nr:hypothetical protein [Salinivirgaceae bacterium]
MKYLSYYALLLFLAINLSQCSKDEDFIISNFNKYKTTSVVDHDTNIVSLGDTIWIRSIVKDFVQDSASGKEIYFTEAKLDMTVTIRSWNTENQTNQPDNYKLIYNTTVTKISQLNEATMTALSYDLINDAYMFELGVVFSKKGIFSIDTDYLYYKLANDTEAKYYGGGSAVVTTIDNAIDYGSLYAPFENENNNFYLYETLSAKEKLTFEEINSIDCNKYYFINVLD